MILHGLKVLLHWRGKCKAAKFRRARSLKSGKYVDFIPSLTGAQKTPKISCPNERVAASVACVCAWLWPRSSSRLVALTASSSLSSIGWDVKRYIWCSVDINDPFERGKSIVCPWQTITLEPIVYFSMYLMLLHFSRLCFGINKTLSEVHEHEDGNSLFWRSLMHFVTYLLKMKSSELIALK